MQTRSETPFTSIRVAGIRKAVNNKGQWRIWRHWKAHTHAHTLLVGMKTGAATLGHNLAIPQKVKESYRVAQKSTLRCLSKRIENIRPHKHLCINVRSSMIHNSQQVEVTAVSIN